ncbi:holo-[acyl-carrier protein] synthase [Salirhabdus euzebyi]|uniref:Holo-[acyl-carrier-protein] synthase n=2 Tax=Salirhabdus euzebyi TaxID=394506 RepID=A0A841Q756_9BACI|nr:holo-[acyl-carrier protein] synthase [Salirhabdus euzebyi]
MNVVLKYIGVEGEKMIKGLGIDLVELKRIEKIIKNNERFYEKILTKQEREFLNNISSWKRKIEYTAGRFAAKEAYAKAYGTGIGSEVSFLDIEVISDDKGKPEIYINGEKRKNILVSISHGTEFVIAEVIIQEG